MSRARRTVTACAIALLAACTDPRARPVPPLVDVQFSSGFKLTSPGTILGSVYMFDDDGLDTFRLTVRSADSTFTGDSLTFLPGDFEATRVINWTVPSGLAVGSLVSVIVHVSDFAGFSSADTVKLTVQTAATTLR